MNSSTRFLALILLRFVATALKQPRNKGLGISPRCERERYKRACRDQQDTGEKN